MICFLMLMGCDHEGMMTKSPDYIHEKTVALKMGYDAFALLDIFNMRKVVQWHRRWGIQLPPIIEEELRRQEDAFTNL